MNTTENNKIIAEFMGLSKVQCDIILYERNSKGYPLNKLKFHSDWNWLIEVVEKIERLNFDVTIFNSTTEITSFDIDFKTIFGNSDKYSKIEAVYNACVEFIKWYNQQNKM